MKKEFLTPSMNITSFDAENVVTSSTNEAKVTTSLGEKMAGKITVDNKAVQEILITW